MSEYNSLHQFIWHFITPFKGKFFIVFLVSFAWAIETTVWPYLFQVVVDTLDAHDALRSAAWTALKWPVFFGLFLWVGIEIAYRIQGFLLAILLPRVEANIRMCMFDHVQQHSPNILMIG